MNSTQVNKPSNYMQIKRDRCRQFKCKCMTCRFVQFCGTGCNTCKHDAKVTYCGDYGLSINRAKNVVSDIKLKNMLLADRHSNEYKAALNNMINNIVNE